MKLSHERRVILREGVRAHLARSGSFGRLAAARRDGLTSDLIAVSDVLIEEVEPTSAAGLIAEVDFPGFVADLIGGTFEAVVDATIQQMEAYADLLRETASGLDGFSSEHRVTERLWPRLRPSFVPVRPGRGPVEVRPLPGLVAPRPENIRAFSVIQLAYELETLGVMAVVEKVVERLTTGELPIQGADATALYQLSRTASSRIDEGERRAVYERVLGPDGGASDELGARWRRFCADVEAALTGAPADPRPPSLLDPVRASGLALARLTSERGGGTTPVAARTLGELLKAHLDILERPQILLAFGVRDRWQLIERVMNLYLGGSPDVTRHRERASSGVAILEWIATHVSASSDGPLALAGIGGPVTRWLAST